MKKLSAQQSFKVLGLVWLLLGLISLPIDLATRSSGLQIGLAVSWIVVGVLLLFEYWRQRRRVAQSESQAPPSL